MSSLSNHHLTPLPPPVPPSPSRNPPPRTDTARSTAAADPDHRVTIEPSIIAGAGTSPASFSLISSSTSSRSSSATSLLLHRSSNHNHKSSPLLTPTPFILGKRVRADEDHTKDDVLVEQPGGFWATLPAWPDF
ncbi:hypothetical protein MLD38_033402 [Melastoma candidum]|uniref:Uncharacterized protein n=1 Tax=Melastoma candidum TaxID=119954 RepID=A0ACB9M6M1_9MYRT|nr:hypothetical protein MLD38_033402 [Melastoma candidum]